MKNSIYWFVFLSFLLLIGCNNRPKNVMSDKEMENFLFEMHLLESSLRIGNSHYSVPREQQFYYQELLKKHNITKADYDSCIVWYTNHPKQYNRIYDRVLKRIDRLKVEIETGKLNPIDSAHFIKEIDIWDLNRELVLNKDSAKTKFHFTIVDTSFTSQDIYELAFYQRVSGLSDTLKRKVVLSINYLNGKTDSLSAKIYNDSVRRHYFIRLQAKEQLKIKSITGTLFEKIGNNKKAKIRVEKVKLLRKFNPFHQDSIRQKINKIDTLKYDTTLITNKIQATPTLLKRNSKLIEFEHMREDF